MSTFDHSSGVAATALLRDSLALHLAETASGELSVLLLGASTPGLAADLLQQGNDKIASLRLIEADAAAIDRALSAVTPEFKRKLGVTQTSPDDLRGDPAILAEKLRTMGCGDLSALRALHLTMEEQSQASPMIANASVDMIIVDMLFNRMTPGQTGRILAEAFRVLKRNGLFLTTVLLADEAPPPVSLAIGAWRAVHFPVEQEVVARLEQAGYHGMQFLNRDMPPAIVHGNAELGVFVLAAHKGKQGICLDQGHAVIFRGPWREAFDDDGHRYGRGERTAVCAKTYALLMQAPYRDFFIGLPGRAAPPLESAPLFDCATPAIRHPRVTKGLVEAERQACCM
jgi:hypothetical protein